MGEFTSNILDSAPPTGKLESTDQLLGIIVIVAINLRPMSRTI